MGYMHQREAELRAAGDSGRAVLLDVLPPLLQRGHAAGLRPVTLAAALPPRRPTATPA